ncbi:hypothetical protein PENSPDRAFT_604489 [Peniophora sp. CONT]|nr:hypothetical protein PENSPDRAFT_604489 [Peniophora sp. CONT]
MRVFPLLLAAASVGALSTRQQTRFDSEGTESTLDWDRAPSSDATGHLIFNSVSSVLQRWPNTIKRPGHSFVPATMPAGTILYHGRGSAAVPTQPEWLAFDFEHAYIFARGQDGHVLTFATTRSLKLIYLDGASAAKIDDGSLDTQDLLMYREVKGGDGHERGGVGEHERIQKLCAWAKPLGVDGFVRMEFHFEVMYCDFSDGVELVSALHLLPQGGRSGPVGPGGPPGGPRGPGEPGRGSEGASDDGHEEHSHRRPYTHVENEDEHHHHRPHLRPEDDMDVLHDHSHFNPEVLDHERPRTHHHDCEEEMKTKDTSLYRHHRSHRHRFSLFEFVANKLGLGWFFSHKHPDSGVRGHAHGEPRHPHQGFFNEQEPSGERTRHDRHEKGGDRTVQGEYPYRHRHEQDGKGARPERDHGLRIKADKLDGPRFSSQEKNGERLHHHTEHEGHEHKFKTENIGGERYHPADGSLLKKETGKFSRSEKDDRPSRRPSSFPHPSPRPQVDLATPSSIGTSDRPRPHQDRLSASADANLGMHASDEPPRRGPGGPGRGEPATPPAGWKGSLPSSGFGEARVAGKWHDAAPGETRVRPDFTGFVSLYDPALRSLVEARHGLPHIRHRIKGISGEDADTKMKELEEVLTRAPGTSSGVDWASITRVVIERYGQRLELLAHTLASTEHDVTEKAKSTRAQLLTMLVLYFTVDDVPSEDGSRAWLAPVVQRCATTQTRAIPASLLTPQERLIHNAVSETLHEICRRLAIMFDAAVDIEESTLEVVQDKLAGIERETTELMAWLDWSVWVKCRPACSIEEMCVVPTWPFGRDEDPYDMTPKCVRLPSI